MQANIKCTPVIFLIVLVAAICCFHSAHSIGTINIFKHRYPFYGYGGLGYGGGYGGYGGGYNGINIGGGGFGRR